MKPELLKDDEEEVVVEGVVLDVTETKLTIETSFGWCTLPFDKRTSWQLSAGMKVRVRVNGMNIGSLVFPSAT